MGTTTAHNAQQKNREFTARDGRLLKLREYRNGLSTYVRFCDAGQAHAERTANWPTALSMGERSVWIDQNDNDEVTPEVISVATRIVVEIGLHHAPFDPAACLDSLREILGHHVDYKVFEDVRADAIFQMNTARSRFIEQGERSGRSHKLAIPRLVEPEEIAKAVNLTRWRKHTIWGGKLPIREVDARPKSDVYHSTWTKEQHREHRELAKRFNRKPETIADWRRSGDDAFAARVAEMEAILLDDDMLAHHGLPGEHPFETSKRVRSEWKKLEKKAAKRRDRTVTAKVRLWAERNGVSESTGWRDLRKAREMSRFDSADVTFDSGNEPIFRGLASVEPRKTDLRVSRSRVEIRDVRLSKMERSGLKEWYERKTGRKLTDAAIRKRRERGALTTLMLEMRADRKKAAMDEAARAKAEKDGAARAEATPVVRDAAYWEECEKLADMLGPVPEPETAALLMAA